MGSWLVSTISVSYFSPPIQEGHKAHKSLKEVYSKHLFTPLIFIYNQCLPPFSVLEDYFVIMILATDADELFIP